MDSKCTIEVKQKEFIELYLKKFYDGKIYFLNLSEKE
jgi:hypothetical protein